MQDWQSQFETIRANFLARASQRLDAVNSLLEKLYCQPEDEKLLHDIRQHFHWLCGVGGTYKLPEVSELGWQAEELCEHIVAGGEPPSASDVSRLQTLLAAIQEQFKPAETAQKTSAE